MTPLETLAVNLEEPSAQLLLRTPNRGVFRALLNINDEDILQKYQLKVVNYFLLVHRCLTGS